MRYLAWVMLLVVGAGCGGEAGPPTGAVSGTVTFKGQPVQDGVIVFEAPGTGHAASGLVKQGQFEIDGGVVAGSYKVAITPPPPPPPDPAKPSPPLADPADIPQKYRTPATSDLTAEIRPGTNELTFDLKPQ